MNLASLAMAQAVNGNMFTPQATEILQAQFNAYSDVLAPNCALYTESMQSINQLYNSQNIQRINQIILDSNSIASTFIDYVHPVVTLDDFRNPCATMQEIIMWHPDMSRMYERGEVMGYDNSTPTTQFDFDAVNARLDIYMPGHGLMQGAVSGARVYSQDEKMCIAHTYNAISQYIAENIDPTEC